MANGISKETFAGMDVDSKLGVLFDYAQESYHNIEHLKKRGFYHKCCATIGGIVGGFLAALGLKALS